MAYYSENELKKMGYKFLGKNVKIIKKASIYNSEELEIGDNSRIDDFAGLAYGVKVFTQSD